MRYRKYFLTIVILVVGSFIPSCSNEEANQSSDTQSVKAAKAKIVYFSIPG